MESEGSPSMSSSDKCCECDCSCSNINYSGGHIRSVKRKYAEFDGEVPFRMPDLTVPQNTRVEVGNECIALRETVNSQQQTIQDLLAELEEERNASSSATSEAMSMILRLQREKADIQTEARQFKRFAEEKMAHDDEEMLALDDLLCKMEEVIQSLTFEVEEYKHRMMSNGLTDSEADRDKGMIENLEGEFELPPYEIYPPLKCNLNESQDCKEGDNEAGDIEEYAFGEIPSSLDQFKVLECRINELERSSRTIQPHGECMDTKNALERVIVDHSPRQPLIDRVNSLDAMGEEMGQDHAIDTPKSDSSFNNSECLRKVDNASDVEDEMSDRVYTIDFVQEGASLNRAMDRSDGVEICGADCAMTSGEPLNCSHVSDLEIQKLFARLNALEADRESMRQAIVSIGTEKAQLVLLKEIAQNLCKEMSPAERMASTIQSVDRCFSYFSIFKWVISFVSWRRKGRRSKYTFGLSANNTGLLMVLDRTPRVGHWKSMSIT